MDDNGFVNKASINRARSNSLHTREKRLSKSIKLLNLRSLGKSVFGGKSASQPQEDLLFLLSNLGSDS